MRLVGQAAAALGLAAGTGAWAQTPAVGEPVTVYAAGSLRAALTELARAFETPPQGPANTTVMLSFGPSGLLKERIEKGEAAHVFASANMNHPEALSRAGKAAPTQAFARNRLCGLSSAGFQLNGNTLAQRLLDADVRVGISTPKADPSGDYAFELFERIESSGAAAPGSAAMLKGKALQLTGGPQSPQAPAGRSLYGMVMSQGQADIFFTYCTNAAEAQREVPALQVLQLPNTLAVGALYGITTTTPVQAGAAEFVAFVLSARGQKILATHGFAAP